jgi:hypothetical protein
MIHLIRCHVNKNFCVAQNIKEIQTAALAELRRIFNPKVFPQILGSSPRMTEWAKPGDDGAGQAWG